MKNDIEVVDFILKHEGWKIKHSVIYPKRICCYNGSQSNVLNFMYVGMTYKFVFASKVELRKNLLNAEYLKEIYENKIRKNPWHGKSNEEILVMRDLENCDG